MKFQLAVALLAATVGGCAVVPVPIGPVGYARPRAVLVAPVVVVARPYYRY